jgi:hypothetical protein
MAALRHVFPLFQRRDATFINRNFSLAGAAWRPVFATLDVPHEELAALGPLQAHSGPRSGGGSRRARRSSLLVTPVLTGASVSDQHRPRPWISSHESHH